LSFGVEDFSNDSGANMGLTTGLCIALLNLQSGISAENQPVNLDLPEGLSEAILAKDPSARNKRCAVANVSRLSGEAFYLESEPLSPGEYTATVRVKLPVINHENTAPLHFVLKVEGAATGQRAFDILLFERAQVYQPVTCRFSVVRKGKVSVSLTWERKSLSPEKRAQVRVSKKDIPKLPTVAVTGNEPDDLDEDDIEVELSTEPPVSGLKYLYVAVDSVTISKHSDVGITKLEVDKVRYSPGEKPKISLSFRNHAEGNRKLRIETFLVHDLDDRIPVDSREVECPPTSLQSLNITGPALNAKWGYAVRCHIYDGENLVAQRGEYFTVHNNLWAVLITGRKPAQFSAHVTEARARAAAQASKRRYQNFWESGFWAPDEFGDFTPDTEYWWGGQGNYYGGRTGTKTQNAEAHKVGISCAVYSNIWGGDGPPAFELIRRQPEWGYASTFNVAWLDRWDRNPMGTGRQGWPMHVWPLTIVNHSTDGPIEHHGRELIEAYKTLGWDAVRYDSHGISNGNANLVRKLKKVVFAELPNYQFGYNSSVPGRDPSKADAFRAHCADEGGIMEEGIRQFGGGGLSYRGGATYDAFANRLLSFKAEAREFGGHFIAIGMDKAFPNDLVYQYIIWLAGNTHPCYAWSDVSVANYNQFATRFAGQLWDLNVKPMKSPEQIIDIGEAKSFLWRWKEFVHEREMPGGRNQWILHLVNTPKERVLFTHDDAKVPEPQADFPISVMLPPEAKLKNVWFLTAENELTQEKLKVERTGKGIRFTVPKLRFWSSVVIDWKVTE
jgi:hypothetical protein